MAELRKNVVKVTYPMSGYGYNFFDERDFFLNKEKAEKEMHRLNKRFNVNKNKDN